MSTTSLASFSSIASPSTGSSPFTSSSAFTVTAGGGLSGSGDCSCNDFSMQTANTGIATVSVANPNLQIALNEPGSYVTVYTAASGTGDNGSTIKSITIKAQQPTSQQGMVRLFISNGAITGTKLYREIPIPVTPIAATTPVPAPQYIMYNTVLLGSLKLNPGYSLIATTQNAQSFSVIAEGLDWAYPETITLCCDLQLDAANTGLGSPAYNTALDGSGAISPIFQAGTTYGTTIANGSLINTVTIKALQSTQEGAIRLFVSPDGANWTLMQEIYIPQTVPSAYVPSFQQVVAVNFNLQSGYFIGATTQNDESYAITVQGQDWIYG